MGKPYSKTRGKEQNAAGEVKKVTPHLYEFEINLENRQKQVPPSQIKKLVEDHVNSESQREIVLDIILSDHFPG